MIDSYEIVVLAEDYEDKRLIFKAHAMANLPVDDLVKARESMIAFHLAQAEMLDAWARLEKAKRGEIWK